MGSYLLSTQNKWAFAIYLDSVQVQRLDNYQGSLGSHRGEKRKQLLRESNQPECTVLTICHEIAVNQHHRNVGIPTFSNLPLLHINQKLSKRRQSDHWSYQQHFHLGLRPKYHQRKQLPPRSQISGSTGECHRMPIFQYLPHLLL